MKNLLYALLAIYPFVSFGQIGNPTPNLDLEPAFQTNGESFSRWDFSKHPYKTITMDHRVVDRFDSIGRHIERTVDWKNYTDGTTTKYKGDQIVESTWARIYARDENGQKKGSDEILSTRLTLNEKGRIVEGKTLKLTKDSIYTVSSYQYYDKQNRLTKSANSAGTSVQNFYYSGKKLSRIEETLITGKTRTVTDKTYKYNKDNQIVLFEWARNTWEDDKVKEHRIIQTVKMEYRKKLLVRKTLVNRDETIERTYAYDNDRNLITFIETTKNNSDGLVTGQVKRTWKYENKLLVYSEIQEGLSRQQGKFSFTYYFHSGDQSLSRAAITDNSGNVEVRYVYNDYGHLIQTITTLSDTPSSLTTTVYDIEYY